MSDGLVRVTLFKPSGKYYTEEFWPIPERAVTPADMLRSPAFRRISGGPVLVDAQEPWGYPHLFPATLPEPPPTKRITIEEYLAMDDETPEEYLDLVDKGKLKG